MKQKNSMKYNFNVLRLVRLLDAGKIQIKKSLKNESSSRKVSIFKTESYKVNKFKVRKIQRNGF